MRLLLLFFFSFSQHVRSSYVFCFFLFFCRYLERTYQRAFKLIIDPLQPLSDLSPTLPTSLEPISVQRHQPFKHTAPSSLHTTTSTASTHTSGDITSSKGNGDGGSSSSNAAAAGFLFSFSKHVRSSYVLLPFSFCCRYTERTYEYSYVRSTIFFLFLAVILPWNMCEYSYMRSTYFFLLFYSECMQEHAFR